MGRRSRQREKAVAPSTDYPDAEGNVLTLRGSMSAKTRRAYAAVLAGTADAPGAAREDAWHRAAEFLFERLAVRWEIAGLPLERQAELLARYRMASTAERDWVRATLRTHLADHFPELEAP
ncbi:MAG: hypothetical protein ACR2NH_05325 [Solirubrobacteraceae bacterium]